MLRNRLSIVVVKGTSQIGLTVLESLRIIRGFLEAHAASGRAGAVAFLQWLIALPFLVVKLGGRYRTVGLFVGCSAVFYAAGSLSLHRFVERYGYRRVLWVALPSVGASTMLCAFAPNLPVLFVLVSILSILLALFWASWE